MSPKRVEHRSLNRFGSQRFDDLIDIRVVVLVLVLVLVRRVLDRVARCTVGDSVMVHRGDARLARCALPRCVLAPLLLTRGIVNGVGIIVLLVVVEPRGGALEIVDLMLVEVGIGASPRPRLARAAQLPRQAGEDLVDADGVEDGGEGSCRHNGAKCCQQRSATMREQAAYPFPSAQALGHRSPRQQSGHHSRCDQEWVSRVGIVVLVSNHWSSQVTGRSHGPVASTCCRTITCAA